MRKRTITNPERDDDPRWQAVLERSPAADGRFVYAVRTTHIFCRPTCPALRPQRRNVEFFATPGEASLAGYRACKRCRPERGLASPATEMLGRACEMLASEDKLSTPDIAASLGLSISYFHRFFRKQLGVTPQQYRRRVLARRARRALDDGKSVTAAIYDAGYGSSSRFYEHLGAELGMKPSVARRRATGERIAYCVTSCSLGVVCIAWTKQGVCDVSLGEDHEELVCALQTRFAHAALTPRKDSRWARAIVRGVDKAVPISVPLDIRGTAFQERVWHALRSIPRGETRSYTQLACELGVPSSARAVARACAQNTLAVLVPCHRVVRSDGALAGYRWGVKRKQALLHQEAKA